MFGRSRRGVRALTAATAVGVFVLGTIPAAAAGRNIHITKSESGGKAVAGATFKLFRDDPPKGGGPPKGAEDTVEIGTCTTAANGQCDIPNVPRGDYWLSETGPPAGYTAAADQLTKVRGKNIDSIFIDDPNPGNTSVNDPTGDELVDNGTHIFQFGPSVAVSTDGTQVGIAFNDSAGFQSPGGFSGVGWAFSTDGGQNFVDRGKIPPGNGFIFAQPSSVFDPATGKFFVASQAAVLFGGTIPESPILVSAYDPATGLWDDPVNTFPSILPSPAGSHDPWLVADTSNSGDLYLSFTLSNAGDAQGMYTTSTDGGQTWTTPVSVTGPGKHDFMTSAVAPNDRLYVAWTDFADPASNTFMFSQSGDGGQTWSPATEIATVPKSGTSSTCGSGQRNTYLGEVATQDAPRLVVDPSDPNTLFVTYPRHGDGSDEGDIAVSTSTDGGLTWTTRTVLPSSGTQFFPDINVTPDGRIAVAYYEAESDLEVDFVASFYDVSFDTSLTDSLSQTLVVNDQPFELWNVGGPYDTNYSSCFGMQGLHIASPGSGFFLAWADGGDPGPAGNNGIDPNIEFARFDQFLATATSLSVHTTASKLEASGEVTPPPLLSARVTVTLFVDDGPGGFEMADRNRPKVQVDGGYSTTFSRPDGGTCRIVATFPGSDGRVGSSVRKTFDC